MLRSIARVLLLASLLPVSAVAGQKCEERPLEAAELARAGEAAFRVYRFLEQTKPEAAILGRVGADMSAYGLKYTHAGIVLRDHPKGRWLLAHVLNECGTARSRLYDEGLMNFFLDRPYSLDTLVILPTSTVQRRIARLLNEGHGLPLHQPAYSLLASPRSPLYQNSNGWVLEVIAVAQAGKDTGGREARQTFLALAGFHGSRIHLSPLKQLGADLFSANVRFDDHPSAARAAGEYEVVTVEALADYLQRTAQAEVLELRGAGK